MKKSVFGILVLLCIGLCAAELYPAGTFETNSIKPLWLRRNLPKGANKADYTDGFTWKIQGEKFFSGKQALLLEEKKEGCTIELNLPAVPCEAGKSYEFSFRYFIEESNPNMKVGARVVLAIPGQRGTYMFPNGKKDAGVWNEFKFPFKTTEAHKSIGITLWLGAGPCKVYLDDFSLVLKED